jgi:hypothetical protein
MTTTVVDIKKTIANYPDKYLPCRSGRVHWFDGYTVGTDTETGGYIVTEKCIRCGTKVKRRATHDGYRYGGAAYDYSEAPGYRLEHIVVDKHVQAAFRMERIRRSLRKKG